MLKNPTKKKKKKEYLPIHNALIRNPTREFIQLFLSGDRERICQWRENNTENTIYGWLLKKRNFKGLRALLESGLTFAEVRSEKNLVDIIFNFSSKLMKFPWTEEQRIEAVHLLHEFHFNWDTINSQQRTALMLCVNSLSFSLTKLLLSFGVNPNIADSKGWSPIHMAIDRKNQEILEELLLAGADVNSMTKNDWFPLGMAALKGNLEMCKILVHNKADINQSSKRGNAIAIAIG